MTQKNIDIMDLIVTKLAEGVPFATALKETYIKRSVSIPFNDTQLNVSIDKLGMSKKITYALIRGGISTIADIVQYCKRQKITTLKGVGVSMGIEVFEAMLNYLWDNMSTSERVDFLIDIVEKNEDNLREELM